MEIGSTGLDVMLVHTLNIITAKTMKVKKKENENALEQLWRKIINDGSFLWIDVLDRRIPHMSAYHNNRHV